MRTLILAAVVVATAACVTPPESPDVQAAYIGPVPEAPSREQLINAKEVTDHVWLSSPEYTDYEMLYPRNAWYADAEANVRLDCLVQDDGSLACAAEDDGFPRYDFEQAARNLSTRFRVAPHTRSGEATAGRRLRVTVGFRLE